MNKLSESLKMNRETKAVLVNFGRMKSVRLELVKQVTVDRMQNVLDLTALELAAVLSLLLAQCEFVEVQRIAIGFSHSGWHEQYNPDFYTRLEQAAQEFAYKDMRELTGKLLRLGQLIARTYGPKEWEARFEGLHRTIYIRMVENDIHHRMV